MPQDWIDVRGARVHNLKNIDVQIPRRQLVVVTGLSGSGKSSLAFDTVYAEGQRRYVESLSAYARQFLEQVDKPDVDQIDGLSPAISIEQRTTGVNPRSTVGTVTEIYDYFRLLFANIGIPHCCSCGIPISSQSVSQIVEAVTSGPTDERVNVLAPIVRGRKGEFKKELASLRTKGFLKARVDGEIRSLEDGIRLDRRKNHWIEVVVDRLLVRSSVVSRVTRSVELALTLANDVVIVNTLSGGDRLFSRRLACVKCGVNMPELSPRIFSFNSLHGACSQCQGLGAVEDFDPVRIVPDHSKSLADGAIDLWAEADEKFVKHALSKLARHFGLDLTLPFARLSRKHREVLLYGPTGNRASRSAPSGRRRNGRLKAEPFGRDFEGIIPNLRKRYEEGSWEQQEKLDSYRALRPCPACSGDRLRPESCAVKVKSRTISDYVNLPIAEVKRVVDSLQLEGREALVGDRVVREIRERLEFLTDVGVGYLTLARGTATLSGGEAQRIRLATQIGSNLSGVLYVLDEPSIGLHQRDNRLLLGTLSRLRDLGNTVVVVEHDEETIRSADYVIDLGRGAGEHGGEVIFQGPPSQLLTDGDGSLTGQYLRAERTIPVPVTRRPLSKGQLIVRGARENNLKSIDVAIPLGLLIAVTGVSGSGKSTLVNDILYRSLARAIYRSVAEPGAHDGIEGLELIDKIIQIDQSPIGRTPRSNPATYTGAFTFIRDLFAMLPESRARGYKPGRFSFNIKGGRCETCQGAGLMPIEMHFLPNVYVTCEHCKGRRYNRETLEVSYRGTSIADVLNLTVDQAMVLLEHFPTIAKKMSTLQDVGLGYIQLGQSATTLSGGEAQRVKLSKELSRRSTGKTLYILDEPTTGLHFEDTSRLLDVLNKLVDQGNTVVVIEHHLDVIKSADHVIDLGPEGGEAGGEIVAEGTPEEVAQVESSWTGRHLGPMLQRHLDETL